MNVNVSENWESFIRSQVQSGRYHSEGEVLDEALSLLRQREQAEGTEAVPSAPPKAMTEEDFKRQLVEAGLMTALPTRTDPPTPWVFQPVKIEGEPLSETIIRERR